MEDDMFKHILLAVDGSPLAESAFRKALPFAREANARVGTSLSGLPCCDLSS